MSLIDNDRQRFEKMMATLHLSVDCAHLFERYEATGVYRDNGIASAWTGWCLALAAELEPKPREAGRTLAALVEVDSGAAVAPTARKHGIQPSTLFRALKRRREAAARPSAPTPGTARR